MLSIIIISYNTKKITQKCLDTVLDSLKTSPKLTSEIIVVDNNSQDDSPKMLASYAKMINKLKGPLSMKVLLSKENLGFGMGNNKAAEIAQGNYLLFLNSDTEAVNDAIPHLLAQFKKHDFDFAGARLLNKDGTKQPSVGRFYTPLIAFAALFLFGDKWGYTRSSPNTIKKVDWVSGACFITTASTYKKINGFSSDIFLYWEEVDLFYRAAQKSLTVGYLPEPTFVHLEGASSSSRTKPILKVFEGYLYFYKKHHSRLQLAIIRYMLQLKALISIGIGKLLGNRYLIETYTQAYEIAQKN